MGWQREIARAVVEAINSRDFSSDGEAIDEIERIVEEKFVYAMWGQQPEKVEEPAK
jgi:hypothetical protein